MNNKFEMNSDETLYYKFKNERFVNLVENVKMVKSGTIPSELQFKKF